MKIEAYANATGAVINSCTNDCPGTATGLALLVSFSINACLSSLTALSVCSSALLSETNKKYATKTILFNIPAVINTYWKSNYLRSVPYVTDCKKVPRPDPDFIIDSKGGSLSAEKFSLIVIETVMSVRATEKNMKCYVAI